MPIIGNDFLVWYLLGAQMVRVKPAYNHWNFEITGRGYFSRTDLVSGFMYHFTQGDYTGDGEEFIRICKLLLYYGNE